MNFAEFCKKQELFQITHMEGGIFVIQDVAGVEMYLIEGSDRAVLLDSGIGIGNVNQVVERLTDKPVDVYLTHGHVDHGGGIYTFSEAWVPEGDLELLQWHTKPEFRLDFASAYLPELKEVSDIRDYLPYKKEMRLHTVCAGDVIELGGRSLEAVNFRGHTQGSVGYYDDLTKTLFAGDGCNNSTFLFLEEAASVTEYRNTLSRLKEEWMDKVEHFVICHGYVEVPLKIVDEVAECCDRVINGAADGEEFVIPFQPFQNGHSFWAAKGGDKRQRLDGKMGNLIYDSRKI